MAKASLTSKFKFYLMLELLDLIFKTLGAEKDDKFLTVFSHFHTQTLSLTLESVNETLLWPIQMYLNFLRYC